MIRFQHPPSVEGRKGGPPSDINRSVRAIWNPVHPNPQRGRLRVPSGCQVGCKRAGKSVPVAGLVWRFGGASHPSVARAENGPAFAANRRKPRQIAYSHLKMAPYLAPEEQTFWAGCPDISA